MKSTRYFKVASELQMTRSSGGSVVNLTKLILMAGVLFALIGWQAAIAKNAANGAFPRVSAVSESPTNSYHPGKAIWVDLVTTDVKKAASFYHEVFGWEFSFLANDTFAEASYQGRSVGSITVYDGDEAVPGDAQWLVSFSSGDIDAAISRTRSAGGKVLEGPFDLEGRGRLVLISDPAGAELMLLHATGGDPDDKPARANEWLWAELWTMDTEAAAGFYLEVLGLKSLVVEEPTGEPYLLLGRDGVARAGVVKLPFEDVEPNWMPYILVESIKNTVGSIEKHGGKLVMAPGESADKVTTAIMADPTGGVFAIQQRSK